MKLKFKVLLFFLISIAFLDQCTKKKIEIEKETIEIDLVGIWQENPKLEINQGRTIIFYENKEVSYYLNQDECYKKEKALLGQWLQSDNKVSFFFDLTILLENGNLERIKEICATNSKNPTLKEKIVRSVSIPLYVGKDIELQFRLSPEVNIYYPSLVAFDSIFYKTSNDPSQFVEKFDLTPFKDKRQLKMEIKHYKRKTNN